MGIIALVDVALVLALLAQLPVFARQIPFVSKG